MNGFSVIIDFSGVVIIIWKLKFLKMFIVRVVNLLLVLLNVLFRIMVV